MGAATITFKRRHVNRNRIRVSFDLTFSASYATNGDTLAASELAKVFPDKKTIADLNFVDFFGCEAGSAGHDIYFDRANLKVKAFNGTAEIANATDLHLVVVRCLAEYGDSPSSAV